MAIRRSSGNIHSESPALHAREYSAQRRATIFYATQTGTALLFAIRCADALAKAGVAVRLLDLDSQLAVALLRGEQSQSASESTTQMGTAQVTTAPTDPFLFVVSCYHGGLPPASQPFLDWLYDLAVLQPRSSLPRGTRYAVFGLGSQAYAAGPSHSYNRAALDLAAYLQRLGASPVAPVGLADAATAPLTTDDGGGASVPEELREWIGAVVEALTGQVPVTQPQATSTAECESHRLSGGLGGKEGETNGPWGVPAAAVAAAVALAAATAAQHTSTRRESDPAAEPQRRTLNIAAAPFVPQFAPPPPPQQRAVSPREMGPQNAGVVPWATFAAVSSPAQQATDRVRPSARPPPNVGRYRPRAFPLVPPPGSAADGLWRATAETAPTPLLCSVWPSSPQTTGALHSQKPGDLLANGGERSGFGEVSDWWPDGAFEISPHELADVEDLGFVFSRPPPRTAAAVSRVVGSKRANEHGADGSCSVVHPQGDDSSTPEFFTPSLRKALATQGYKLIGTHSALRLGRWTKASLRGRGACFKRTFFGILSYTTMEMSPSLPCASKCVFCWRHPETPTASAWKWKVDDPLFIVEASLAAHSQLVNSMRDVHGVRFDRLAQAQAVQYCDLSLVGEPLLYPRINELIAHLHARRICTCMYTNGQFPDKVKGLAAVTQLVISASAPTAEGHRQITQPLFTDAWQRLLETLDNAKDNPGQKVLRVTVIKGWNDSALAEYAELVRRGAVDFVEVKGVIYCGKTDGNHIKLDTDIPQHEDLLRFAHGLCGVPSLGGEYGVAAEHEHSSCVLVAHRRFLSADGQWRTWIDAARFFALDAAGQFFGPLDYALPTPSWALLGSEGQGMDPTEVRHRRRRKRGQGNAGGSGDDEE